RAVRRAAPRAARAPRVEPRRPAARARLGFRRDPAPVTATRTTRAAPAMGTAISRRGGRIAAAVGMGAAVAAAAGCGSQASHSEPASSGSPTASAWLHATPAPTGWPVARIPTGAELAYPPSWRHSHGDPGTAT